jgi:hypothetical protein
MKTIKFFLSFLIIVFLSFSCKKEHAVSSVSAPEFYFNGTVGGVSTSLNAGINNYYMYSSYIQDSTTVYSFIGDLKQTTSDFNSIQIQINDSFSLASGSYPYSIPGTVTISPTSTSYQVQFNSSYTNGTAQTYNWNFGDGGTSTLPTPTHTYSQMGYYNVCLNITGSGSCSNSVCDTVNLASSTAYVNHTTISSTPFGTNGITFRSVATGTPPFLYSWNFGDSIVNNITTSSDTITHTYIQPGTYQVSLHVKDANGNIAIAKYNVTTANATQSCLTNFSVANIQAIPNVTPNYGVETGNVIIIWTDAVGNVYTSKNAAQPSSSGFQIISVDNYQNNTNNQHTKKLHVKFNCWVYNSTQPPIQITNADAIIAVAYK